TATGSLFPQNCQLAIGFAGATGNTVSDLCKGATLTFFNDAGTANAVTLDVDPFAQANAAASIPGGKYFQSAQMIPQNTALTVQPWSRQRSIVDPLDRAWTFSDLDLDFTGGVGIGIPPGPPQVLVATTCTDAGNPLRFADLTTPWPGLNQWHFV